MRLLHRRHGDDRRGARSGAASRSAARAQGKPLPLHRLSRDLRRARRASAMSRRPAPGEAFGRNLAAPAGPAIVTGRARYTMDVAIDGLLHMKILRSPHPSARIARIDASAALAAPGVVAVLTHEDAPPRHFSTARHELFTDDPDDTLVLDPIIRFVGQRVAAVVADERGGGGGRLPAHPGDLRTPARRVRPRGGDASGRAAHPRQAAVFPDRRSEAQHRRRGA